MESSAALEVAVRKGTSKLDTRQGSLVVAKRKLKHEKVADNSNPSNALTNRLEGFDKHTILPTRGCFLCSIVNL